MTNLFFIIFLIIQIIIFVFVILIYSHIAYESKVDTITNENNCNQIAPIEDFQNFELIRQIIDLDKFTISFKTVQAGYLYVTAKSADLCFDDESSIKINKHLDKFYLDENENIKIENIVDLKNIRFKKITIADFIEDVNKGIFKERKN